MSRESQQFSPELPEGARPVEWLETNGLGGYASGTDCACNSRRYHGLLVINLPGIGRHVLLSNVEDWLLAGGKKYALSSRRHPGVYYPDGPRFQTAFAPFPCPSFTYEAGGFRVTRELMLLQGRNVLLIRYTLARTARKGPSSASLQVAPLLAFRSFHSLTHKNDALCGSISPACSGFSIHPYKELPPLTFQSDGNFTFVSSPLWIERVEYTEEERRGFDFSEDLFLPGSFTLSLQNGESAIFAVSPDGITPADGEQVLLKGRTLTALWEEEENRRRRLPAKASIRTYLAAQSGAFLITDPSGHGSVLAGYPWFDSWGRDTLIALPGTAFLAGRREQGKAILDRIGRNLRDGRVPNTFTPDGAPKGDNSADASLAFAWCAQELISSLSGKKDSAREKKDLMAEYLPVLSQIIEAYGSGGVPHVTMDEDGLLRVGTPDTQLTWMDAQVSGHPVTPRWGWPVEIQALWFNTLSFARHAAKICGAEVPGQSLNLENMRKSFARRFVMPDGTLCDVWRPAGEGGPDASLRPNQLFAISLPYNILEMRYAAPVVEAVTRELLTPYGLRTLSKDSKLFRPVYQGGPSERDGAYHQGCVWPWLLGAYADALFKVEAYIFRGRSNAGARMEKAVSGFLTEITPLFTKHLTEACVGHISEIFSATDHYSPDGCVAQAWREGDVLRALCTATKCSPEAYDRWERKLKIASELLRG